MSIYNVMDYGATGDGTTNDAPAIQDALDAAGTAGGIVYAPQGNFKLSATLSVPSAVSIVGDGIDVTSFLYWPTSGNGMEMLGDPAGRKHALSGFTLSAENVSTDGIGIAATYLIDCLVQRVRVHQFQVGYGLAFSWNSTFVAAIADHCSQDGLNLDEESNQLAFFGCKFTDNGRAGAYIRGSRALVFTGCDFESNAQGVYIVADTNRATKNVALTGCYFEGQTTQDVWVKSLNSNATVPESISIRDNYFQPLTTDVMDAIQVDSVNGVAIEGNVFDDLGPYSYSHSVYLPAGALVSRATYGNTNVDRSTLKILVAGGSLGFAVVEELLTATEAQLTTGVSALPGQSVQVTLTANRTVAAPQTSKIGQSLTFLFVQDSTGGRAVSWAGAFNQAWSNSGNTSNKRSSITFLYDGTYWNQIGAQSAYY